MVTIIRIQILKCSTCIWNGHFNTFSLDRGFKGDLRDWDEDRPEINRPDNPNLSLIKFFDL